MQGTVHLLVMDFLCCLAMRSQFKKGKTTSEAVFIMAEKGRNFLFVTIRTVVKLLMCLRCGCGSLS
jgi:hypothetical protein